jgi:hypothetical protein
MAPDRGDPGVAEALADRSPSEWRKRSRDHGQRAHQSERTRERDVLTLIASAAVRSYWGALGVRGGTATDGVARD